MNRLKHIAWFVVVALSSSWVAAQSSRPGFGATPYADAGGTGVTFRVWAPNATSVAVPGQFNGWSTTANVLTQEGSSGIWSADVATARPGHRYKYHLDGSLWRRDPRGRMVEHSAGNSIVYDSAAFNWEGDTRIQPALDDLVIYEMHVGAFHDSTPGNGLPGTFADAIARLDYLQWLGVNAVEVMPVAEFPGDFSWGYNPADPYAVERIGYGGADGLKSFVKACHERGIAVLLDVVHNHYGPTQMDLWEFDGGADGGIYFYSATNICCTSWGNRPDYSIDGVRDYITDNFRMWLGEFHIDGFRWDTPGTMQYYDAGGGNYLFIPDAASLIAEVHTMMDSEFPGTVSIAEDSSNSLGFESEWARTHHDWIVDEMKKTTDASRDVNRLYQAISGGGWERTLYSESHDSAGNLNPGAERLPVGIDAGDSESYWARKRSMAAAAAVLTAPAIPMLFMGQETLTTTQFGDQNPLDWGRTNSMSQVLHFYRDLIRLRRNLDGVSAGLRSTETWLRKSDNGLKFLAFQRGAAGGDPCMVVFNMSASTIVDEPVVFPEAGSWYANLDLDDQRYGDDFGENGKGVVDVAAAESSVPVTIGPYSVMVFSRNAHPARDADGDGMPNGWEATHFGGATNGVASADGDGDGATNLEEYIADTLPGEMGSVLKIRDLYVSDGGITVEWQGGTTARQVVAVGNPGSAEWSEVHTNEPPTPATDFLELGVSDGAVIRIEARPQ